MAQVCENYCIALIRAVMQEQPVPEMPEGVTLKALFAFAKKHSVEALVYHGLCALEPEEADLEGVNPAEADPVWQHWGNRAQMLLTQSLVQLADRDILFEELTAAGIDLLPVKGCWLKEQYPEIDYRQMGDLDILIHKADRESIRRKMLELGYVMDAETSRAVHVGYKKEPYTEVEMHFTLLPWEDPRHTYYDRVWERAEAVEGMAHLYRLRPEDEYIYYILHLQKHALDAGIGIKAFLDSVVYRSCYPDMDRAYVKQELEDLQAWEFAKQVERLADCWFLTGAEVPAELGKLAESALEDGVYGTEERMLQNRLQALEEAYRNPVIRKLVYWGSRIFLSRKEMECYYPVLERLPVLLPFCWLARLVLFCFRQPKKLFRYLKIVGREGKKDGKCETG